MAGPQTERSGQIRKPESNGNGGAKAVDDKSLAAMVLRLAPEIAKALPSHFKPDRMARVVTTALRTTPDLAICTQVSFMGCVFQCAQLGLEPNTPLGHAYLIPRNNKNLPPGQKECTLIIGYQGLIDIAARAGVNVYAYAVRSGDVFSYKLGLKPDLEHVPSDAVDREDKAITHVYAVFNTKDGRNGFIVLTSAQVEARRKRSAASKYGPWVTDWEAMALKTAVRALWKWMPKSVERIDYIDAEGVEVAADRGVSQLPAMSAETGTFLLSTGIAKPDDLVETTATTHDPVTGEVNDDGTLTDEEIEAMEAKRAAAQNGSGQ